MNASKFMDKQIMDLSRSKSSDLNNNNSNSNSNSNDFLDLMNPQSEEEETDNNGASSSLNKKEEILPSYDFQPIHRPLQSLSSDSPAPPPPARAWNSIDPKPSSPFRSYNSVDHIEPDRIILEKAQKTNDSAILSEVDGTVKRYIDSVLHAIDGVSARLSQLESRTRHLEHSVDELKVSVGNNHGSADGKMRQLENILLEVQTGVQDLKDKQDVMEGQMNLAKLQISKAEKPSEPSSAVQPDPMHQKATSAQQPALQQFSMPPPQQVPSLPPNAPPPSQQNIHSPPGTTHFPLGPTPPGPQQDAYFIPHNQTQDAPSQQYQMLPPPPAQQLQQPFALASPPQQYQSTQVPPYPQPPQPSQQQHPGVVGGSPPQVPPSMGLCPEEGQYIPSQSYPPNLHQPPSLPSSTPPNSQKYYGSPQSMYEPPSTGRSGSGFQPVYSAPSGPVEQYSYAGPASHYSSGSSMKAQPHSHGGSNNNYPQLPTAKILPPSTPVATGTSGGSNTGGSGNRVPIDDVIEKVTNMGFPRDLVRATVRKLTENGQSVDLNVVLDKLMNDGDVQSQGGWFGR